MTTRNVISPLSRLLRILLATGTRGDGEMGRWRDGETGRRGAESGQLAVGGGEMETGRRGAERRGAESGEQTVGSWWGDGDGEKGSGEKGSGERRAESGQLAVGGGEMENSLSPAHPLSLSPSLPLSRSPLKPALPFGAFGDPRWSIRSPKNCSSFHNKKNVGDTGEVLPRFGGHSM